MYYDFIQQNKRRVIAGVVAFFLLIVIWAVFTYVSRIGKIDVYVAAVPNDATVTFDGTNQGTGTKWVTPGDYTVVAKKDGFATVTRKVRVSADKTQNVVAMSLTPQSADAKKWANDHQIDYQKIQEYGTIEANTNGEYFAKLHPITTKLPFTDPYFKIGYETKDDQSIVITISTPSPRYRFYAVEQIRKMGYDPTDFKISFKDFHNPLGDSK